MKALCIGIIGLILLGSCEGFLEEEPQTALTQDEVFGELDNIEPLILGLYTSWRNTRKDRGGFMFSLGSDESRQGAYQVTTENDQAGLDRYDGFLAPGNNALAQQWDSRWPVVSGAAQAIYALEYNVQDEARRLKLLGEASFVRAAVSFELVQYWGEIPVIDLARFNEFGTARQSLEIVYGQIISDLELAIDNLPETQGDKRRATKGAAQALLGKVYLSALDESGFRDYQKAKELFEAVINSGTYSLVSQYSALWEPGSINTSESIYEFQFNNIWPDNNQTQWQMGSRVMANHDQYCFFGGYDLMLPTAYCYDMKSNGGVWEDGDLRRQESIRFDFEYNGFTPDITSGLGGDELDPHIKKYEDERLDGIQSFWYSGKNIFFLRYSDILLCYAECLNELGSTGQAVDLINTTVRARAWGGTLPAEHTWSAGMSADEFRDNIMDERMRELCFEGWRRMDLIRTGNLVELVSERNVWAKESGTIAGYHSRYPIPLTEIQQNEEISVEDQNPGYANQ